MLEHSLKMYILPTQKEKLNNKYISTLSNKKASLVVSPQIG